MFIYPAQGTITSPFGMRVHPISGQRSMHWGIDISNHANNAIVAAGSGNVRFVDNTTNTSYGKYLIITHSNGYETLYAHLASISVRVGQSVNQGQQIGIKGTTGNSTGVHLHFEVHTGRWNNQWSNAVDPKRYIGTGSSKLTIDGLLGTATIKAMQRYFGTAVDGVISEPSAMVIALQKLLGIPVDGHWGPATTKALQKRFGTVQDGIISVPSAMIMELQRRLNNGKL